MDVNNENYGTLNDDAQKHNENVNIQIEKKAKRIIHCSNGTIEQFDDDQSDAQCKCESNDKNLTPNTEKHGGPVNSVVGLTWTLGRKTLHACDYLGEKFTNFLGITTPKYEFEINEYQRMLEEEKIYKEKQNSQFVGWKAKSADNENVLTKQNLINNTHNETSK